MDPNLQDLKFIEGKISGVIIKTSRVGFFVQLKSDRDDTGVVLNIESATKEANELIRNFKAGEPIKVWYSDEFLTKYDSVFPWKIETDGAVVISFEETKKRNALFRYAFGALALMFFVPGLWFMARGQ